MYLQQQLQYIRDSLTGIYPELAMAIFFLFLPVLELILLRRFNEKAVLNFLQWVSIAGAGLILCLVISQWGDQGGFRFSGLLFLDNKAVFFKILVILAWLVALIHIRMLRYDFPAELYTILAGLVLGILLLCMATHLLTIYLSIELISLSSYLLIALSPRKSASEGGLKYLLYGTVSSAIMLYGISFIYGMTGTLHITDPAMLSGLEGALLPVSYIVALLFFGGLLFKLSLVPFHLWAPDVYESAPSPLISFISVAPKVGVVLCLMRLVGAFPDEVLPLLGGIALISMTVGNVGALWQHNFRRLMAYSSIAQAGYLMVGVVAFSKVGFETATFYIAAYLLLNMAVFLLVDLLAPGSDTNMHLYAGLGKRHVLLAIGITLIMVALAGLPPTVGFTAKWLIFSALWDSWQQVGSSWKLFLLIGGILNAAISLAYYLKLPYLLFFKTASDGNSVKMNKYAPLLAGLIIAMIFLFFAVPGLIYQWVGAL